MNGTQKGATVTGLLAVAAPVMLLMGINEGAALVGMILFGVIAIVLAVLGARGEGDSGRVLRTLETKNSETTIITPDTNLLISYCNPYEETHKSAKKFVNRWMNEGMMYVTDTVLAELSGHPIRERIGNRFDSNLKRILDYCGIGGDPARKSWRNFEEIKVNGKSKTEMIRKKVPHINEMYRNILNDHTMRGNVDMWCVRKNHDREELINEKLNRADRSILAEAALLADANYDLRVTLVSMDGDFTLFPIPIRNEFGIMAVDGYELFRRG